MPNSRKLNTLNICDVKHLTKLLGTTPQELNWICRSPINFSRQFIQVKKGKRRPIAEPNEILKPILQRLNNLLQRINLPDNLCGGRKGRSHIQCASMHSSKPVVLTFDIKDFYPSISNKRIYNIFNKRLGCKPDIARVLTRLTTINGCLPQGFPTSTILSCLVSERLAIRLSELAKQYNSMYSQWVDDIAISGSVHIERLQPMIIKIIRQEGFDIKELKCHILESNKDQVFLGIMVNSGIDVPKEKLDEVRNLIASIEMEAKQGILPSSSLLFSTRGKISYVTKLNRGAGNHLRKRYCKILSKITYTNSEISGALL